MTGGSLGQRALSYGSLQHTQNSVVLPFHATPIALRKPAKMLLSGPRDKEKIASRIFKIASRWRVGMLLLLLISGVVFMLLLSAVTKDEDLPEGPDSHPNPIIHFQNNITGETMPEHPEISGSTGEKDSKGSNDSSLSNSLPLIDEHKEQTTLPSEHPEVSVSTEEKDNAGSNDSSLSNSLPMINEQSEEPTLPSEHSAVSVNSEEKDDEGSKDSPLPNGSPVINEHEVQLTLPSEHSEVFVNGEEIDDEGSKDSPLPNSSPVINEHEVQLTLPLEHPELSVDAEEKDNQGSNGSSLSNSLPVINEHKEQPTLAYIGNNISRGHPCENFALPPPTSDRKRIGPRPCPVCYLPVEQAMASMPGLLSSSPVLKNLTYVHDENPVATEPFGGSLFGGYPSLKQRNDSYDIKESMTVHCGFVRGSKPGIQSGFDIDDLDLLEMEQCHGVVVASAIFGNYDILQQPKNISEAAKENACFYMFVDEETEAFMKNSSGLDDKKKVGLWRIVVVRNLPYLDARRNGKIPKLLLHRIFTNARFSIWVDGKLQLVVDPYQILERFLWRKNATFAISKHYRRFDVFVEAEANKAAAKYDNASIDLQIEFYRREGLTPYSEAKLPIISDVPEGCVIIREHIPITNLFTCLWFNEVDRFTSRDQISFSTVRDKIMSKVNWSINMFMDCERRNFVVQAYHRDLLEHMASLTATALRYPPPFIKELPRKPSPEIVNVREIRAPIRKRGRERRSGSRRHRTRIHTGNRDAISI